MFEQLSLFDILDRPPLEAMFKPDQIYESNDPGLFARLTEDPRFDRKSASTDARTLAKYLSAFGNGPSPEGGVLAIGLEKDGSISGCKRLSESQLSDVESCGSEHCPDGRFQVRRLAVTNAAGDHDFIVLVRIEFVEHRLVQLHNGDAYERLGDECKRLTDEKKQEIKIDKGERSFEQEPSGLTYPDDFDLNRIRRFCELIKHNVASQMNHSDEAILSASHLATSRGGKLVTNNACALLFANDPQAIFPGSCVHFLRYEGTAPKFGSEYNVVKDRIISGDVIRVIKDTAALIDNTVREFTEYRDGKFHVVPEYPRDAWYEMVVNAVVHRSYHIRSAPVFVRMFDDRLEVESPGGFMPQITAENIVGTHRPRNRFLMLALREYGEVRCISEGTRRIVAEMHAASLPPPEFRQERDGMVKVVCTLRNNVGDRSNALDSEAYKAIGEALAFTLDSEEKKIINFVIEHGKINASAALRILKTTRWHTAKELLDGLMQRGILRFVSKGGVRNSHSYYEMENRNG